MMMTQKTIEPLITLDLIVSYFHEYRTNKRSIERICLKTVYFVCFSPCYKYFG